MPAIRYSSAPNQLNVVNHYSSRDLVERIWLKAAKSQCVVARLFGFICVAGSNHLVGAKLGKLLVRDITNGDGVECEWREVPYNEYVYAMVLPGDEMPICHVIIGHDGWPITTLDEFRNFPKCPQSLRNKHIYRPS